MKIWHTWPVGKDGKQIAAEITDAKKVAAAAAPAKLNTQAKQAEIKDKTKVYVDEVEVQKLKEVNAWDGKGKKPVKLGRMANLN